MNELRDFIEISCEEYFNDDACYAEIMSDFCAWVDTVMPVTDEILEDMYLEATSNGVA